MDDFGSARILVVAPQFPAANQPWIDTYLQQLLAHNFDVAIYSLRTEDFPYSSKVDSLGLRQKIVSFPINPRDVFLGGLKQAFRHRLSTVFSSFRIAVRLTNNLRGLVSGIFSVLYFGSIRIGRTSLIHSHDEGLAYHFLFLAKLWRVPLVLSFHGLPPTGVGQLSKGKRRILYREVTCVVVNTEFAKRQVCELGCPSEKITILPQGLCLAEFPFRPQSVPGLNESVNILTVGRYHRDKGQGYALLALKRLINEGHNINWVFVGVGPDLPRLRRLAGRLGVSDCVRFLVELPHEEVIPLYHECHLFVLPSIASAGGWVETQGVVLQEAQASGCIPIASRVGGVVDCVNHNIDAILVKTKSSREIANAVEYLIERKSLWVKFQSQGRRNVEERYCADAIGKEMSRLLGALR